MRSNVRIGLVAAVVAVALAVVAWHHTLARFAVSSVIGLTTGYHVDIGEMRLGRDHGAFLQTHVSRRGEAVLDAKRVDLYYHLRDLLPGSRHRFGLVGITIDHPQITVVHHRDGTYNLSSPGGGAPGRAGRPDTVPLHFYVRVRDGEATLLDEYSYYTEARVQRIAGISANVSVDTSTRTSYHVAGAFKERKDEPFRAAGAIDYLRGYAIHHVRAASIPVKTIGNYVINSPAAHILAGTASNFDAKIFALGIQPNVSFDYHVSARADFSGGQLSINGLSRPLENMRGTLQVFDGGLGTRSMRATLGGIPVKIAGAIFDFAQPQFRLGIVGAGDLHDLRSILAFSRAQPISGQTHVDGLIEGPTASPLLLFRFDAPAVRYAQTPLSAARGLIAIYRGDLALAPFSATYSGIALTASGHVALDSKAASSFAVHFEAPAASVPYIGALVRDQRIGGDALVSGAGSALGTSGYIASFSQPSALGGFFDVDSHGVGNIGPLSVAAPGGGRLLADYHLDRPHNTSAFWASARDLRLHPNSAAFAGLGLPPLPALDGTITDANVVGVGNGPNFTLAGRAIASDAIISGIRFNALGASFAGNLQNAAINQVSADGPWGRFDGQGSFSSAGVVARGNYSGSFEELRAFTGPIGGRGSIDGPLAIALSPNRVVIQADNARLGGASVRGVPLSRFSGTVAVEHGAVRVYSAQADIAGGEVVAAGPFSGSAGGGALALTGSQLQASQLRGLGIPLESGNIDAAGTMTPGGSVPSFTGGIVVRNGRAQGYDVNGSAQLALAAGRLQLRHAVAALGPTYALLDGDIFGLGAAAQRYDLYADVPAGDIVKAARTLHIPTHSVEGSFNAQLQIRGAGSSPLVRGTLAVPVGDVNGLGFLDASAIVAADRAGVAATSGDVLVDSTRASFSGSVRRGVSAVAVTARRADLSDFNDFFDTGDTLDGTGSVAFSILQGPRTIGTSANINVDGFRYRRLPIGDTDARWSSNNNVARGFVQVGGPQGTLRAAGTLAFAPSPTLQQTIARSRYDIGARLANLDLSTWLPAFGFPTIPITGRVDGDATVKGRYPRLGVGGNATLRNGTLGSASITRAHVTARAAGSRIAVTSAEVSLPALEARGSGSFGLGVRDPIAFSVHAATNDVPKLVSELSKKSIDVNGSFESTVQIGGTLRAPTFAAGVAASNATVYGVKVPSFVGSLALAGRSLLLRNAEVQFAKGSASLAGQLPLQISPLAIGPATAPLSLDIASRGVELAPFSPLLGNDTKLAGTVDGHLGLTGSADALQIFGTLGIVGGSYVSAFEKQPISGTVAQIAFNGSTATVTRLHANMGHGSLDASGSIGYAGGLGRGELAYNLKAKTRGAQLDFPLYGRGTVDSNLTFTRRPPGLALLAGTASVLDASIPFSAFTGGGASSTGDAAPASPLNVAFDLTVNAGRNVHVRSGGLAAGLDISGKGSVKLAGTLKKPTLDGQFESTGGTLTYVDHAFKVKQGTVTFTAANGVIPDIFAVGTTHVTNPDPDTARNPSGSADITLRVSGSLANPNVAFESRPPGYSKEQIIALLLPFGGFFNGIQFSDTGQPLPAGQLRGAPVPQSAAILPGVLVRGQNGSLSVGQEAFNILNAQFTSGLLTPIENALGTSLGLSDVSVTVGYTGDIGFNFRRLLTRNFYAVYATSLGVPVRQTFGLEYQPNPFTAAQLSVFFQQGGASSLFAPVRQTSTNLRATAGQALQGTSGFTFTFQRLF
ncbi:MAG: translocation/assembly module TamB domain-containing protein [Candidatus Eremiobacteraeota bacterium]|nr:translocation/assembly module TamB domain-containing protein [Candidatus Eremiobacteraeota bacterium]